jgi:hypothetical protein
VVRFRYLSIYMLMGQGMIVLLFLALGHTPYCFEFPDIDIYSLWVILVAAIIVFHLIADWMKSDVVYLFSLLLVITILPKVVSLVISPKTPLRHFYQPEILPNGAIYSVLLQYIIFGFFLSCGAFIYRLLGKKEKRYEKLSIEAEFREMFSLFRYKPLVLLYIWAGFKLSDFIFLSFKDRFGTQAIIQAPGSASLAEYVVTFAQKIFFTDMYYLLAVLMVLFSKAYRFHALFLLLTIIVFQALNGFKGAALYPLQIALIIAGAKKVNLSVSLKSIVIVSLPILALVLQTYFLAADIRDDIYQRTSQSETFFEKISAVFYRQGEYFEAPVVALTSPKFEGRLTITRSLKAFIDGAITPGFDFFGELNGSHQFHYILQGATSRQTYWYQSTPLGFIPEIIRTTEAWPALAVLLGLFLSWYFTIHVTKKMHALFYCFILYLFFDGGFNGGGLDEFAYGLILICLMFKIFEVLLRLRFFVVNANVSPSLNHLEI